MSKMPRCRHSKVRTVELEVSSVGDVYLRTVCGDMSGRTGCGNTITVPTLLGNAEIEQAKWLRVGKKRFLVSVKEW